MELLPSGDPLPPVQHAAASWDPVQGRVLVVGGQTYYGLLDTIFAFEAAAGSVTELTPGGDVPAPRRGHTIVVDAVRERLILFAGQGTYDLYDDVFALDLSVPDGDWTALNPVGSPPPPRAFHAAAFDSTWDRMVVFGGVGIHDTFSDTWELDFSLSDDGEWVEILPSGDDPMPRAAACWAWSDDASTLYVAGGRSIYEVPDSMYEWILSAAGDGVWNEVVPDLGPPDPVVSGTCAWDATMNRFVQVGGQTYYETLLEPQAVEFGDSPAGAWFSIDPAGPEPQPRLGACSAFSPLDNSLYLFGGAEHYALTNEVWMLAF